MIIVSDTSAISNLALIDHLWLLEAIYQTVLIPKAVAHELAAANSPKISTILELKWIQDKSIHDTQLVEQLQVERGLDTGEAHAIVLALELDADDLLIDERLGRQEVLRLGIPIIGILGVLVLAKQRQLVSQVQPVMDSLINQAGFRVSPQLYRQVLTLSQENGSHE